MRRRDHGGIDGGDDHELLIGGTVGAIVGIGDEFTGIAAQAKGIAGRVDEQLLRDLGKAVAHGSSPIADAVYLEKVNGRQGAGATSYATIGLGGPNGGRYWEVTSISVLGSDGITTVAGTNVEFCIGEPSNPIINDIRLPGTQQGTAVTVPSNAQFGQHTFIVRASQKAYVRVYGAATTQPLVAILTGWDRPLWADHDRSVRGPLNQAADQLYDTEQPNRA